MTIGLQITDGITTLDLNDGSYFEVMELDFGYGQVSVETVSGSVRLYINGTKAQCQAEIAILEKLVQQAIEYQGTGKGAALYSSLDNIVYIQYRTDGTESYYRSPIINATPSIENQSIEVLNFDCGGVEYILDFERSNWWEGAEAQVPLATSAASRTTNAVTLYNPWNAGAGAYQNYAHIEASDVGGDLPGATRLEIKNTYNNANGISRIWIGQNFKYPANFQWILEAEDALAVSGVAGGSGGFYVDVTLASGTEADLLDWQVSGTNLTYAAGRWYKALLKTTSSATAAVTKFRLQLEFNSIAIWKGPQIVAESGTDWGILDIGTFQLPPSLGGVGNISQLDLVLTGYQSTGASIHLYLDCLQLTPVDGYRELYAVGGACEYNRRVVDDGITPLLYEDDAAGSGKTPNWVGYSTPIMLQPARDQRLYFLNHSELGGTATLAQTIELKVFYRPRRLTI